jgi:DNA polymerase I
VQRAYGAGGAALRRRGLATHDVTARVRLTRTPEEYLATRGKRRELPYEAMLAAGRSHWRRGERVRVYRASGGRAGLFDDFDPEADDADRDGEDEGDDEADVRVAGARGDRGDPRDYDVEYYVRVLRDTFAARLARALRPDDFAALFAEPGQMTMFATPMSGIRTILTPLLDADARPLDA